MCLGRFIFVTVLAFRHGNKRKVIIHWKKIRYSLYHSSIDRKPCSKLVISVTEHLVEVVDKLSTTAVVFFRSSDLNDFQQIPHWISISQRSQYSSILKVLFPDSNWTRCALKRMLMYILKHLWWKAHNNQESQNTNPVFRNRGPPGGLKLFCQFYVSDLKKTTAVVESLSTTSTRCSVTEITSLLWDSTNRMRNLHQIDRKVLVPLVGPYFWKQDLCFDFHHYYGPFTIDVSKCTFTSFSIHT